MANVSMSEMKKTLLEDVEITNAQLDLMTNEEISSIYQEFMAGCQEGDTLNQQKGNNNSLSSQNFPQNIDTPIQTNKASEECQLLKNTHNKTIKECQQNGWQSEIIINGQKYYRPAILRSKSYFYSNKIHEIIFKQSLNIEQKRKILISIYKNKADKIKGMTNKDIDKVCQNLKINHMEMKDQIFQIIEKRKGKQFCVFLPKFTQDKSFNKVNDQKNIPVLDIQNQIVQSDQIILRDECQAKIDPCQHSLSKNASQRKVFKIIKQQKWIDQSSSSDGENTEIFKRARMESQDGLVSQLSTKIDINKIYKAMAVERQQPDPQVLKWISNFKKLALKIQEQYLEQFG